MSKKRDENKHNDMLKKMFKLLYKYTKIKSLLE